MVIFHKTFGWSFYDLCTNNAINDAFCLNDTSYYLVMPADRVEISSDRDHRKIFQNEIAWWLASIHQDRVMHTCVRKCGCHWLCSLSPVGNHVDLLPMGPLEKNTLVNIWIEIQTFIQENVFEYVLQNSGHLFWSQCINTSPKQLCQYRDSYQSRLLY